MLILFIKCDNLAITIKIRDLTWVLLLLFIASSYGLFVTTHNCRVVHLDCHLGEF